MLKSMEYFGGNVGIVFLLLVIASWSQIQIKSEKELNSQQMSMKAIIRLK